MRQTQTQFVVDLGMFDVRAAAFALAKVIKVRKKTSTTREKNSSQRVVVANIIINSFFFTGMGICDQSRE